ncbi:MAG TPA: hypothetical protein VHP31_08550 [Caproicibacter sp.]|nr:hypothetical protein [Caproicibacter sp.]
MGTYDSMKSRLLPTDLYSLSGKTVVDDELQAYAAGLDPVCDELNTLQKESFLATAEDYGLAYYMGACGITSIEPTVEKERVVLYALCSVTPNSNTKADLENFFSSLGLSVQILEDVPNKKITVKFLKEPACGRDEAQKKVEKFMPAHLTIVSDYSGVS